MDLSILLLALCCVTPILGGTTGKKIHEHMTKEEIESVFHVSHDKVHELDYEVVPVLHKEFSRRGDAHSASPTLQLRAFDKDYNLYLEENQHVLLGDKTPVFTANALNTPSIQYKRIPFPLPYGFKLYHDVETRSAVTIFRDDHNNSHVDGVVGDDVLIRPLPTRVHEEVINKHSSRVRRGAGEYTWTTDDGYTHHVVFKSSGNVNSFNLGSNGDWLNQLKSKFPNSDVDNLLFNFKNSLPSRRNDPGNEKPARGRPVASKPTTRPTPRYSPPRTAVRPTQAPHSDNRAVGRQDTVYPELLIAVDYNTYDAHGKNVEELAKYVAAFWNAVDLRYRELGQPAVRLNIAGLVVPLNPSAAAYFEKHHLTDETLQVERTLDELGNYFKDEQAIPPSSYDVLVGMTFRNLGDVDDSGKLNDQITGIAGLGATCKTETGQATALVSDKGGFSGITTAAHELAHSMGAPHDGAESQDVAGGPCEWYDGYLMSYERKDSRGMHWSKCSVTALREFFRSETAKCLRNVPNAGKPYPKILPGKVLSRDEQCKKSMGPEWQSYDKKEDNCAVLYCAQYTKVPGGTQIQSMTHYRPPAEGSYCGKGLICLDAQCVKDPKA